ncbi:MAG: site-2 protease family protein, partial [Candidatus Krumholzibacteriota bacterium]|nr:site-2 protease family protein [Candidatus Krumholzibacteriota bacterium]
MFNRSIRLFRLWGIPVELNISWVLILILVTWTFATNYFPQYYPGVFSPSRAWILSFFTALLLFVSILLHEFSHSLVAVRSGLPINKITLFMFGGVAQMSREVDNPSLEFRMAAAGPLMTLLLIIVMYALGILLGRVIFMAALLKTVASINAGIFLFNMFPGFPLDGGRILRAVLWRRQGSILRATRTASRIGIVFAYGLIIFGALNLIITQEGVGNLWMVLIGFFLRQAARTSYDSVLYRSLLKNL